MSYETLIVSTCLIDNLIKKNYIACEKPKNVNYIWHDEAVWYNAFHIVNYIYRQTSDMSHTLVDNTGVDHSDVVWALST